MSIVTNLVRMNPLDNFGDSIVNIGEINALLDMVKRMEEGEFVRRRAKNIISDQEIGAMLFATDARNAVTEREATLQISLPIAQFPTEETIFSVLRHEAQQRKLVSYEFSSVLEMGPNLERTLTFHYY